MEKIVNGNNFGYEASLDTSTTGNHKFLYLLKEPDLLEAAHGGV